MSTADDRTLWQAMLDVGRELAPHLAATLNYYAQETGMNSWAWFTLLRVLASEPEPASREGLLRQSPYTNPQRPMSHLEAATIRGYLIESSGTYRFTDEGRSAAQMFADDLRTIMVAIDPLFTEDGARLTALLGRLVQASLDAPVPPEPWLLCLSFHLMPPAMPPLPFSEQAISCLAAYRDDCHVAAWRPSGLAGPAVEALTLLWRGEVGSLEVLHRRLVRRDHPREAYRNALAELRLRGFVSGPDEALVVTDQGDTFRQQVEEDTDHFFFRPWACLEAGDKATLSILLTRLVEGLKQESDI